MIKPKLQEHNTDLSTILSAIGDLPLKTLVEAAAKNGKHVWKRYEYTPAVTVKNPQVTLSKLSNSEATITSNDFNIADIVSSYADFLDGFKIGTKPYLVKRNDSTYPLLIGTATYPTLTGVAVKLNDYSSSGLGYALVSNGTSVTSCFGIYTYDGEKELRKAVIGDVIGYTVSDSSTAYPDGGEKDGYWYERVKEGIPLPPGYTKFAVDKVVFARDTSGTQQLTHSLGVIPRICILTAENEDFEATTSSTYYVLRRVVSGGIANTPGNGKNLYAYKYNTGHDVYGNASQYDILTEKTINLYSPNYGYLDYKAGVEYTLITMA